jgi:Arc/MetJ-type ribon-helix-helix transcriptional regulator
MEKTRVTVRLPLHDLQIIDLFIRVGGFATRSEVIRHAVNEFIEKYSDKVAKKAKKIKKVQEIEATISKLESYLKK